MITISAENLMRFVRIMAAAMDAGDVYTHGRSYRCSKYALCVGRELGLKGLELQHLECAGLLQDLGKKIALHGIQNKVGELTQLERRQMNRHTKISADLLARIPFLEDAAKIIASLNERYDGNGLPAQLQGRDIPLPVRILAVVSALDALTCDRPHRQGLPIEEAYTELRKDAGHRFDPLVVQTVIRLHESGDILCDFDVRMAPVYQQPVKKKTTGAATTKGASAPRETGTAAAGGHPEGEPEAPVADATAATDERTMTADQDTATIDTDRTGRADAGSPGSDPAPAIASDTSPDDGEKEERKAA
ncbi:MAG: HD domain-containing protein [Candidatus Eisenbacteria bacterium]|uniref:HD domain-containing protein n=1 Tax=Eiseniibacteriota bacterium TaxID=2212470 RepID=A0A956LWK7_UNCEI|nr:HD domain-containing protein [Candidatus Eisenbacteria bacterium]